MKIKRNKVALAIGVGVIATAAVAASANTLPGFTAAGNLGTASQPVVGCTGTIVLEDWVIDAYTPSVVNTSGVTINLTDGGADLCAGQAAVLNITGAGGVLLTSGTVGSLSGGLNPVTFAAPVNSISVTGATLTISE